MRSTVRLSSSSARRQREYSEGRGGDAAVIIISDDPALIISSDPTTTSTICISTPSNNIISTNPTTTSTIISTESTSTTSSGQIQRGAAGPTAGRRTGWETGSDVDLGIRDDAPPRMDITLNMRRVLRAGAGGPGDRVLISPWSAPGPR
ncbi:unnamed protein product [Arctogadus glacialis]